VALGHISGQGLERSKIIPPVISAFLELTPTKTGDILLHHAS